MNRSEEMELKSWRSLLLGPNGDSPGVTWRDLGDGAVFVTEGLRHVMFNRAIGVDEPDLPEAHALLASSSNPYFIHNYDLASPAGLVRYPRSWVKLRWAVTPAPPPEVPAGLALRPAQPADAPALAKIYCDAFDIPERGQAFIRALVGREGWHIRVMTDDDEVVGVGLLFVDGDEGCLAGGATRPSHRRRGVQRALVQSRLHLAGELGLVTVWSETGEERAGEEQHSYRNMTRAGFEPVGVRHNHCAPGTTWGAS